MVGYLALVGGRGQDDRGVACRGKLVLRCLVAALTDPVLASVLTADLVNVFEVFLPQLLLYPNPTDPLNGEAAAMLMREPEVYNQKVKGKWPPAPGKGCSFP